MKSKSLSTFFFCMAVFMIGVSIVLQRVHDDALHARLISSACLDMLFALWFRPARPTGAGGSAHG